MKKHNISFYGPALMKGVVISGVAGMTGSSVAKKLLQKGYRVIGFDNFFAGSIKSVQNLKHKNFSFKLYDINNKKQMKSLFKKLNKDWSYINCAAVVHTKHFYHPDETFNTNVNGMVFTLKEAVENHLSSYINCSSSEVYSMNSVDVKEKDSLLLVSAEKSLRTSYAVGKLLTEYFIKDAIDDIPGCSIRFSNVYSPEEAHKEHIIPYIIANLPNISLLKNAKYTKRTFLHNDDSSDAVIRLLETEKALDGSVYNVGSLEEISIPSLVKKISKIANTPYHIQYQGVRSADPKRRLLNISKIKRTTGWSPRIPLSEGLKQCVEKQRL